MALLQNPIFIQALGFIGTILVAFGMQQKSYNKVVFFKIANEFASGVHYLLLGGTTGMAVNFAACFTNAVYWYRIKKGKSNTVFQILFGIMFVAISLISWHGWISIFVLLAKLLSSISLGINNTRVIRFFNLISTPCWLVYNIYMFSIPGMISDSIVLFSVISAIIRIDILKK